MVLPLFMVIVLTAGYAIVLKRFAARPGAFGTLRSALLLGCIFGVYCVLASLNGIKLPSSAIVNVRDTGALLAGMLGGPIAGLLAGLIGGVHRLAVGTGAPGIPCAMATMFAGIIGSLLHARFKGGLPSLFFLCALGFLMEGLHMVLIMLTVPEPKNWEIVSLIALPMILANAAALGLFALLFREGPGGCCCSSKC